MSARLIDAHLQVVRATAHYHNVAGYQEVTRVNGKQVLTEAYANRLATAETRLAESLADLDRARVESSNRVESSHRVESSKP